MSSPLVVIADDDPLLVGLLEYKLAGAGLRVEAAADGGAALERIRALNPQAVVLDAMMPVLNGIDALPAITRGSPSSKVVVYSAFTDDPALERIYDAGAHAVVNKAAPIDQLFLAMSGLVAG